MAVIINILTKILPFLGPLLEKLTGGERSRELREQKQLEELRAFQNGRVTPRYLLFYCLVGIFTIFSLLLIVSFFVPSLSVDFSFVRELIKIGHELGVD